MLRQGIYFFNQIKTHTQNYSTTTNATTSRLCYSFKESENYLQLNRELKNNGFYISKNNGQLLAIEKKNLRTELENIKYFNANKKNEAAIIQTQFGVHKINSTFTIYPCENESPFDVAYELLIESRPVLSCIVIQAVTQLLNIEEFKSYAGMSFSIVLLKYVMESYLQPHKDENYLFSLMTTLQARNMYGSNCLYTSDEQGLPGYKLGKFSDSYYKIVDNRDTGVFHDAHTQSMNPKNVDEQRDVLIVGIKNHFCQFWSKPDFMRTKETLLPIEKINFISKLAN